MFAIANIICYHTFDMSEQAVTETSQVRIDTRHLLWIGIAAPILIVIMVVIAAAVTPNHSQLYHAVSRLGIDGMEYPAILNASMIVYGLVMCVFAYAIYDKLWRGRNARLLSIPIVVHGIGVAFAGVFNDEIVMVGEAISTEAIVHTIFAVTSYLALLVLIVIVNLLARRMPFIRSKWLVPFSVFVVVVSMPLVALFITKSGGYLGLFQRVGYGVTLLWMVVVTLKLILFMRQLAKLT